MVKDLIKSKNKTNTIEEEITIIMKSKEIIQGSLNFEKIQILR
jgi:hypothetical protein